MNLKKTKTPIMGVAAFLIILFHLLPISRSNDMFTTSVRYIVNTAYISVDIFFFMSAYMAYFSERKNYFIFIKRKFLRLYPIFIFSCVVFLIMGNFTIKKAIMTLLGVELVTAGGGSFLWFIPALMIFYIFLPGYIKLSEKFGKFRVLALTLVLWAAILLLMETYFQNHSFNIFMCRIPVTLIGYTVAQYEGKWKLKNELVIGMILLVLGMALTWNFGYMIKAKFFVSDIFYVIALPHILGALLILDVIFSSVKSLIFKFLGKMSLELYCFQMVFGAIFLKYVISIIGNIMISFIIVFSLVVILSYIASILREKLKENFSF